MNNGNIISKNPYHPKWLDMFDDICWFDPFSYTENPTEEYAKKEFVEEAEWYLKNGSLSPEEREKTKELWRKLK